MVLSELPISLQGFDPEAPIQIAPQIWWVGMRLPDDRFQCHAYYLDNGSRGVLIDPGSPLTIEATLRKVARIRDLEAIRYIVCHHCDPDIAASLPLLSERLKRPDVEVVTEWRAQALLRHYGHRFSYYRVEEHGWCLPLAGERRLEFQLTPYLHFPGAFVSFDTGTGTLFSSDLFGGFVPDAAVLESSDVDYLIDNARPFHQHYMPSRELLTAGLNRIQLHWPRIQRIAPQHGHIVPGPVVAEVFQRLTEIDCGVFCLADADLDLKRLLRISQARGRITEALISQDSPTALVASLRTILASTGTVADCELAIDLPGSGWCSWGEGQRAAERRLPPADWVRVALPGEPAALLALRWSEGQDEGDPELLAMLREVATTMRPWLQHYLHGVRQQRNTAALREAAYSDALTGLANRRALEQQVPSTPYALISIDIDHFKAVNDSYGHGAGDLVLQRLASLLSRSVRPQDAVYRLGGEEFLLVLPAADQPSALTVAERIRTSTARLDLEGLAPEGHISLSLGIAQAGTGAAASGTEDFATVLERADGALYRSKREGRDRISCA
ncbi:diguanylate cyclase [Vulcanococcus limneticus]|uniref:diguanylate cyclase n=1 Tax=Vulcanococcus limneticus TaxID=2170428 RepID=UPI000B989F2E|nr:diguanylate cyclase [Vulcanococcus limneticus]MCP9790519.1 diguanylate cyclase [Vulcanococcus limneticus MW73D5]MCP9892598.1 diguanylate cyclase [Vulcanococcus limneticus Candia 3F8]MCP9896126.1 diguanylate cyclase [Vulcanococcus limneticus Candia 3B3]